MSIFASDSKVLNISSSDGNSIQDPANFNIQLNSGLAFDDADWYISLINLKYWNTNQNISAAKNNNIIRYSVDAGSTWKLVTYPDGLYGIQDIIDFFQQTLIDNGDASEEVQPNLYLSIVQAQTTTRWNIINGSNYQVDMTYGKINELLGFSPSIITVSTTGDFYADVSLGVSQLYIHCNLIDPGSSISNGLSSDILYAFFPNAPAGGLFSPSIFFPIWIKAGKSRYLNISIKITDQLNRQLILASDPADYKTVPTSLSLNVIKSFDFSKLK